jgi:tetratricopeptide (TPR) repeat protein
MRTYLLAVIACALSAAAANAAHESAAPAAPLQPEQACFDAARAQTPNQDLDPTPCEAVIERLDIDPRTLAAAHNNLGLIHAAMDLGELALDDYAAALALAPELFQARVNQATLLLQQGRYPEALAVLDEALEEPMAEQHVVLFNRALVHRALGNVEQAGRDVAAARAQLAEIQRPQPSLPLRPLM